MQREYLQLGEWVAAGDGQLRHRYSRETAEQRLLAAVPMRSLHHLTAREAYSFPHCPRVHSCSIVANYCAGNDLRVDIALLVEKLELSLAALPTGPRRVTLLKKLEAQLGQLVDGFEYLCRRYGPFLVDERLVTWNSYGMVKVWLSHNALNADPDRPIDSEQTMLGSIVELLSRVLGLNFGRNSGVASFEQLGRRIEEGEYERPEGGRRVKFGAEGIRISQPQTSDCLRGPKSFNNLNSCVSIDSKGHSLAGDAPSVQFGGRCRPRASRGRLSSEKAGRNRASEEEEADGRLEAGGKENLEPPRRKESKTLTCLVGDSPLQRHSRRYSNAHQQQPDLLFLTQTGRRKSSVMREEVEWEFGELLASSGEVSFDSSELEKELEGVL